MLGTCAHCIPPPSTHPLQTAYREKLVRRQLRHVVAEGRRRHLGRLFWWVLALVPQVGWAGEQLPRCRGRAAACFAGCVPAAALHA